MHYILHNVLSLFNKIVFKMYVNLKKPVSNFLSTAAFCTLFNCCLDSYAHTPSIENNKVLRHLHYVGENVN